MDPQTKAKLLTTFAEVISDFPQERLLEIVGTHKKDKDSVDIGVSEQIFQEVMGAHIAAVSKDEAKQASLPPLWDLLEKIAYPAKTFQKSFSGTTIVPIGTYTQKLSKFNQNSSEEMN